MGYRLYLFTLAAAFWEGILANVNMPNEKGGRFSSC